MDKQYLMILVPVACIGIYYCGIQMKKKLAAPAKPRKKKKDEAKQQEEHEKVESAFSTEDSEDEQEENVLLSVSATDPQAEIQSEVVSVDKEEGKDDFEEE
jgi:hypothetical protein